MTTKNSNLHGAKQAKNDEFYTQYHDIEKEMQAYLDYNPDVFRDKVILLPCDDPEWSNFTKYFAQRFSDLGLKKLISTSYVKPKDDGDDSHASGKIFTLTRDVNQDGVIDLNDLEWEYLQGDGDFRSEEVTRLRDEADIIITNPPFSLFREFLAWIESADKKFLVVANKNCVTYKEVFPLIKNNKMWSGKTTWGSMFFSTPNNTAELSSVPAVWMTNIEHGKRHAPLELDTMANNLRFNNSIKNNPNSYQKYDNYDAIEIPRVEGIPSDYEGVMGVPISFLDKYCPEQFEVIGATESEGRGFSMNLWDSNSKVAQPLIEKKRIYKRIFIRNKNPTKKEINNAN